MDNGEKSYRRFLDGDDEGFCEIVRDYKDSMILYVNGIVGNLYIAEEIVQETFTRLIIKKPRFFGRSTFKTWLYAIAGNLARDELRRHSRRNVDLTEVENYIEDEQELESAVLTDERKLQLQRAMEELNEDYRQALWLVYFEEFSSADAARIMKKTKHQFENLLYRAKKTLRSELERRGFVYEEL